jgi:hypothetical protein
MGGSSSKATSIVENEIMSGLSVIQRTISSAKSTITSINELHVGAGCHIKADEINMGNYATVNMKTLTQSMMDAKFTQDIQEAIKQAADSAAKAGIGIAASDSEAISRSITNISAAVTHSIQNIVQSDVISENIFTCMDGSDVDVKIINLKNDVKALLDAVTSSQEVLDAKQSAVIDIAQEIKSLASGLDPTALISIVVLIFVLIGGGAFFGVTKVVNLLTSTQFWFIVSLLGAAGGAAIDLARIGGDNVWPYKKGDDKRNKTILTFASIVGGVGLFGLFFTAPKVKNTPPVKN